MDKLYIVIPCYNEKVVLEETTKRLRKKFEKLIKGGIISKDSRIIYVDDGSNDNSWNLTEKISKEQKYFTGISLSKNRGQQNALVAWLIFITIFFLFWGLKIFEYYLLPIFFLLILFILICLTLLYKEYIDNIKKEKLKIFIILFLICIPIFTYMNANYKDDMKKKKSDYIQYKYAKYINKYQKPTLLNMGYLDIGVYTLTGIIPNTRFFEVQNFSYAKFSDNINEMKKYIKNKQIKFIIFVNSDPPKSVYDNYEKIYYDNYIFENMPFTAYLFKLKEKNK